jgi:nicotinamidase-related amidase
MIKGTSFQVPGDPHPWPRNINTLAAACAVLVIDMQHDYCSPGYYLDKAGFDTRRLRQPIEPIRSLLPVARSRGLQVIYTRHGRLPSNQTHTIPASSFPKVAMAGEPGWQIVPQLSPAPEDIIVEKSTCGAFLSGELDRILRNKAIRCLAFCGNTIDVCVHSTLRAAVDLGYECLLLSDCCAAVNDGLHAWAVESVKVEDGVFGTVSDSSAFIKALS